MPSANELCTLTLTETAALVADKAVSPVELTRVCLERIQRLGPALNAFITVTAEAGADRRA
jgi:aspartyl-tRNA(Asn)/glutamyl-tRNA(Gln) amidotransferase subunit A